jgi:hypothetical protein
VRRERGRKKEERKEKVVSSLPKTECTREGERELEEKGERKKKRRERKAPLPNQTRERGEEEREKKGERREWEKKGKKRGCFPSFLASP